MDLRHYPVKEEDFKVHIAPLIASHYKRPGRPGGSADLSHYPFFCAVLYVLRTGISWRDVPACYGKWHTIYTRFKRWSENGLFWFLVYPLQQKKGLTVDIRWVDSTTIGIHRHGSGASKKKASVDRTWPQGGAKIQVALSPERILGACLSASNQVDMNEFSALWKQSDWRGIDSVIADKGYDCGKVRKRMSNPGKTAVIPRRKGAICPGVPVKERYKTRSAIERFFGKIKENKRLTLRFDKRDATFFSFFAPGWLS